MSAEEVSRCVCDCEVAHVFVEGDPLWDNILADIAAARHEIGLKTCVFADDEIGRRLVEALCERASAGVRVHAHLDEIALVSRCTRLTALFAAQYRRHDSRRASPGEFDAGVNTRLDDLMHSPSQPPA